MVMGKTERRLAVLSPDADTDSMWNLLSPATFLTKICMVASGSAEEAREAMEETEEMLLDRMLAVVAEVSDLGISLIGY
jgi:hypothetical protein